MPVPKRKRSRARRDSRFANKGIIPHIVAECKNCNAALLSHEVCKSCGYYKGTKVLITKKERQIKRTETRQAKAQEAAPASAEQSPAE